jgi:hypothetical protein
MFWLVTDHVLFNNSWNFDFVAEAWDQEYLHLWPVCYSNSDIKIDLQDSCVQLWPRKLALYTQGYAIDFQKLNGKLKILNQPVGKYADMFDLFFISYHESNADENYQNLLKRFPHAKRINGIKGIQNAHRACAEQSTTEMFWTVDADTIIDQTWKFDYLPSRHDRNYIHLWYSRNPVNGLEYGYGSVKLWPKNEVLSYNGSWLDYTTSTGKIKIIEDVIATTMFNSSPFEAWKSAFRECNKLMYNINCNPLDINSQLRLNRWNNTTFSVENAEWCQHGCQDAAAWYQNNNTNLKLINDFDWLKQQFNMRYHSTLTA